MGRAQRERHFKRAPLIYSRNSQQKKIHLGKKHIASNAFTSARRRNKLPQICRARGSWINYLLALERDWRLFVCRLLKWTMGFFTNDLKFAVARSGCFFVCLHLEKVVTKLHTLWNFKYRITVVPRYVCSKIKNCFYDFWIVPKTHFRFLNARGESIIWVLELLCMC